MSALSVGLCAQDAVLIAGRTLAIERGHQEHLGPEVFALLKSQDLSPTDLKGVIVTLGPGSFTGQRIGLSFAKGLALGAGLDLIGSSGLAAMAAHPVLDGQTVLVAYSGGKGQIYTHSKTPETLRVFEADDQEGLGHFLSETRYTAITGNATQAFESLQAWDKVLVQNAPGLEGLMREGLSQSPPYHRDPIYLRAAEAKISQKPQLVLSQGPQT